MCFINPKKQNTDSNTQVIQGLITINQANVDDISTIHKTHKIY